MPPLDLFSSQEFWTAVIVALVGGGGVGAIIGAISSRRKYFALAEYTRRLFHWLQQFCEVVNPDFLERHPKPHLPDELRGDIMPESFGKEGQ